MSSKITYVPHNVNVYAALLFSAYTESLPTGQDQKLTTSYQAQILREVLDAPDLFAGAQEVVVEPKPEAREAPRRQPRRAQPPKPSDAVEKQAPAPTPATAEKAAADVSGSKAARALELRNMFDVTTLPHICPKCQRVAATVEDIVVYFGMRERAQRTNTPRSSVPQPWCKACKRGVKAAAPARPEE